jgi:hypothetical protein
LGFGLGLGVWRVRFRVAGSGFENLLFWGSGFCGLGFGVWDSRFGVWGLGFGAWGFEFRVLSSVYFGGLG